MKLVLFFFLVLTFFPAYSGTEFAFNSFKADFEQTVVSSLTGKEVKTLGKIAYAWPGQVRAEITEPSTDRSLLVGNSKKTWFYTPPAVKGEKGQVQVDHSGKMVLNEFLDILSRNGFSSNQVYTCTKKDNGQELNFPPVAAKKYGLTKAFLVSEEIDGKITGIKTLVLYFAEKQKQPLTFKFSNFVANAPLTKTDFTFNIPPGTEISE
jgi:outer membrane lipoprotein-sorting protein